MHEGEGFLEQYLELLGNPAHWAFELTVEAVSTLILAPLILWLISLHDKRKH